MYHHAKHIVSSSVHSKVIACTDIQTDRPTKWQYENITLLHMQAVKYIEKTAAHEHSKQQISVYGLAPRPSKPKTADS